LENIFFELTLVLIAAGVIAYITNFLKQPTIIAYIITGCLIGPLGIYHLAHTEILHGLSEIGITLLLFLVGLDLDISQLKRIGKAAVYAGIGQVVFTCLISLGLIKLLGFSSLTAWYMAIALTFSSTIIVVKLLSEKKDLQSLYGKLAVGIFLIQDVAAIFILIFLTGLTGTSDTDQGITASIVLTITKAFIAGMIVIWLSRFVFPKLLRSFVRSDELLLLFSLGWALGLATLFSLPVVGFNAAIGGFVAGLALANTGAHYQISGRIKSIRDFFIIIFFIVLGSQLAFNNIGAAIIPALILSAFVLIGNPFIVTVILGLMGYKPRTAFFTGVTVAQISEFSLILMALGLRIGHVDETAVTIVTLVGVVTIAFSSYGILYTGWLYERLRKFLTVFDFGKGRAERGLQDLSLNRHTVIVGAHRLGAHVITALDKRAGDVIIVDHNPDIIHHYQKLGYQGVCGDVTDPYIQEVVRLENARMVVSTVPDQNDNLALLESVRRLRRRPKMIMTAGDETEAKILYEQKADYVIMPHFIGGLHIAKILEKEQNLTELEKLRRQHLKSLQS
jgi:Kef-type K+ transport system membrane component KefB